MVTHQPAVVGLTVCRDVSRDVSGDVTLFRSFTGMGVASFPASVTPFCVVVSLTDGEGTGQLELHVTKLDEPLVEATRVSLSLTFPNRLQLVECVIRVTRCEFPSPRLYMVTLFLDDEWLAQKSIRVYALETRP